ncbi:MAG: fibronectin type III domain-containing protein [Pyrinomonadaceae bacterium]
MNLSWIMPAGNVSDSSILNINRIDVYRLAEPLNSTLSLTEEEFASRSTLIASIPVSNMDFGRKEFNYNDPLDFAGQSVRLRYAIRFVNASGQKAGFSNFLLIEPTARISAPPSLLVFKESENAVILSWVAPENNVDGSKPVNLLGYNVYRDSPAQENYKLLNNQPVNKNQFTDTFFAFGTTYKYFVRAVSLGGSGEPVESLDSNIVSVTPKDVYAPSAPTAITIAAAPENLSIFFAINPEKDIAGYRIYRSENPNLPKSDWLPLTKDLLTTNTFQDTKVESGKVYYYYLTAVDRAGNISEPSEIVSETAP